MTRPLAQSVTPRSLADEGRQYCEGCARPALARLPVGWSQCGPSRVPTRLALWCPACATDGTFDRFLAGLPAVAAKGRLGRKDRTAAA